MRTILSNGRMIIKKQMPFLLGRLDWYVNTFLSHCSLSPIENLISIFISLQL